MTNNRLENLKKIVQSQKEAQGFIKFRQLWNSQSPNKDDASLCLRWAVLYQQKQFLQYYKLLCSSGADVNFCDKKEFKNNLMIACEKKQQKIVEILVNDSKINLQHQDSRNKTALNYAINNKSKAFSQKYVKLLLKKCPNLVNKNLKKNNPILEAIDSNKIQVVKILIQYGYKLNQPVENNNNTVLHEVAKNLKNQRRMPLYGILKQIAQILIQKGADPYRKNAQGKDCFQISQKNQQQFRSIYNQVISKGKNGDEPQREAVKPLLVINNKEQRQKMFSDAQQIFKKHKHLIEPAIVKKKSTITQKYEQQQEGFDDDPFEPRENFINKLNLQIQKFQKQCLNDYKNAEKQLQDFLTFFRPIADQIGFSVQVYGSYATGLWINQCDIDILLVPIRQHYPQASLWEVLEDISIKLKGSLYEKATILKNVKVPLMRIQIGQQKDYRKPQRRLDISILSPINNGKQHTEYALQFLSVYPQIKPIFFIIKKLTQSYKLHDPVRFGVRSFALFLMFVIYMREVQSNSLAELLIGFLYKYGYNCDYQYENNAGTSMILNLPDPINAKNNMGKYTDAFALQRMFKTAYIILHTRDIENRLQYLFDSRQMFLQPQFSKN